MKLKSNHFFLQACGHFLSEKPILDELKTREQRLLFIDTYRNEVFRNEPAEVVENLIDEMAFALEENFKQTLNALVSPSDLDTLKNGVVADIWYDAHSNNDDMASGKIVETQHAMTVVAESLQSYLTKE